MTREEAIRCLSVHSSTNGSGLCTDKQHYEAKQMAIKALEQEPSDISNDGTLTVNVEDGRKITRVLVCGANHWSGLYYPDEQEPKTGHWIVHPKGIYAHLVCDRCLSNAPYDCRTNYCPNCGRRMVEPQESEGEHEQESR